MSKLRILARKCAALLLLLHFLVATPVQHFRETVQHQCSAFFSLIRRIFSLNGSVFTSQKCSSSNTFPNFAQENDDLSERIVISPVDDEFEDYASENDGASIYPADEYDEEDYDDWWDAVEDGENRKSWCAEAVDEIIAEEEEANYQSYLDRQQDFDRQFPDAYLDDDIPF